MCDIKNIKTYILFFNLNDLNCKELDLDKTKENGDYYEKGRDSNFLYYHFESIGKNKLILKKFKNSNKNISFNEFRKRIEKDVRFQHILGYGYKLSELDDDQFIESLNGFNQAIIEKKRSEDVWMNLLIINPIAFFLTDNNKYARGEFIGYNQNINPTVFLLKYPKNVHDYEIEKNIIDKQEELTNYPIFQLYSYRQINQFIADYVDAIEKIINNLRAISLLES